MGYFIIVSIAKGDQFQELEQQFFKVTNRIMMMELMLKANYCPLAIDDVKLFQMYLVVALPAYHREAKQIVDKMNDIITAEISEQVCLRELLGE